MEGVNKNITWDLEHGYDKKNPAYPEHVFDIGDWLAGADLYINLKLKKHDIDLICSGFAGFKLLLHSPTDYPHMLKRFIQIPLQSRVNIGVTPERIATKDRMRWYPYKPDTPGRECYFNNERELKYFKVYTQQNCELECLANYTLNSCGCVLASMPRGPGTKVCGSKQFQCYIEAIFNTSATILKQTKTNVDSTNEICHCLPSCFSILYKSEVTKTEIRTEEISKLLDPLLKLSNE